MVQSRVQNVLWSLFQNALHHLTKIVLETNFVTKSHLGLKQEQNITSKTEEKTTLFPMSLNIQSEEEKPEANFFLRQASISDVGGWLLNIPSTC